MTQTLLTPPRNAAAMLVVVHDVAPPFVDELQAVVAAIRPLVGSRFSCAVVPRWHGKECSDELARLLSDIGDCDEWLLHGWTHHREHRRGIVSALTGGADEFGGLSAAEIQRRIDCAAEQMNQLTGANVAGLVPPAWQLPVAASQLTGLSYVMRYRVLESCRDALPSCPLATWSYDWGWLRPAARAGHALGVIGGRWNPNAVPCVVIHPADVRRGWLPRIQRLVERLLDDGRRPVVPRSLMPAREA